MSVRIRINGSSGTHIVNGAINGRDRRSIPSVSVNGIGFTHSDMSSASPPIGVARPRHSVSRSSPTSTLTRSSASLQDIPFAETPALLRTQDGMTLFNTIDTELDRILQSVGAEKAKNELMNTLIELAPPYDYCEGIEDLVVKTEPDVVENLAVEVGEKRKPYVYPYSYAPCPDFSMIVPITCWQINDHTNGLVLAYPPVHRLDFASLPFTPRPPALHLPMVKKILRSSQSSGGGLYKAMLSLLMVFLGYLLPLHGRPRE